MADYLRVLTGKWRTRYWKYFGKFVSPIPSEVSDISMDYYFGDALRTLDKKDSCGNIFYKIICYIKCGGHHGCAFGKCFCISPLIGKNYSSRKELQKDADYSDSDEDIEITPKVKPNIQYEPRPALRHHIAHFCPNLDEARKCIRTCMKLGKPAFCGKDHVCYCGHRNETPKQPTKQDVSGIYTEFRDMYEKYFGTKSI
ncbi:uncharacterized protein LOC131851955 [Achroia grisella]|uniref:uncharacterized protein LOC131851955 n=1 Tax=Achroia grisella TaxID=688607 RepID=UPI0027D27EC6|nr:uncharacterized protein LOC131851955 [Achroia grisella]